MKFLLQFDHDRYKFYSRKSFGLMKLVSDLFWLAAKIEHFPQNVAQRAKKYRIHGVLLELWRHVDDCQIFLKFPLKFLSCHDVFFVDIVCKISNQTLLNLLMGQCAVLNTISV